MNAFRLDLSAFAFVAVRAALASRTLREHAASLASSPPDAMSGRTPGFPQKITYKLLPQQKKQSNFQAKSQPFEEYAHLQAEDKDSSRAQDENDL